MFCRFENRLENSALVLSQPLDQIHAYHPDELGRAWTKIQEAHQQGHWLALVLNYELGAHLLACPEASISAAPLLSAYVFQRMHTELPWPKPTTSTSLRVRAGITKQKYLQDIATIQAGIKQGEYYQINYSIPLYIETKAAAQQLYQHIAHAHPVAYGAFLSDGDRHILSFSPELFVKRCGEKVIVKPMKGTTARHNDPVRDHAAAVSLRQSAKDVAENIMIVDLLRNDLSQLAEPGSVHVSKLLELEAYPSVWTMTSTIQATIASASLEQLMTALFPCGSITGTPKRAAMRCIKKLEQRDRGIYCGSIGWLAPSGDLQLNVAIRTIEYKDEQFQFGVGGAIVIDSDPELEWQECLWKARVLGTEIHFD